jgi:hypothetical protein
VVRKASEFAREESEVGVEAMNEPDAEQTESSWNWVRTLEVLTGLLILVAFVLPLCRRSINLSDEGYILLQSLDMLNGKILYRDMDAFVSPGIWFLLAGLFHIVEPSVLASRVLCLGAYVSTVVVAYAIVARFGGRIWGALTALLFMIFVVWAFPIWTFTFYSPFAVLFVLAALERMLAWRANSRTRDLLLTGFWFGMAISFKQNYGAFGLVGGFAGLAAIRLQMQQSPHGFAGAFARDLGRVAIGGFSVGLPLMAYFLYHGAFDAMFQSLVVHPFVFAGQHSVAYLSPGDLFRSDILSNVDRLTYGAYSLYNTAVPTQWLKDTRLIERLHVLLYLLPPLAFAGALAFSFSARGEARRGLAQRFDAGIFSVMAVCGMLFLGVFPRADYNHLINLYQPVLVVGMVVAWRLAQELSGPYGRVIRAAGALGAVLVLAYASVAVLWYQAQIEAMSSELAVPRGGVLVRPEQAMRLDALIEIIWRSTDDDEAILSLPDLSMLNFLAEREMPSPYYNLYQHHIAHDGGEAVVRGSESKQVRLAVTRYSDFFSDRVRMRDYAPKLIDYLDRYFEIQVTAAGDNFVFLRRRVRPMPRFEVTRLLEDCELDPPEGFAGGGGDHRITGHLLFTTLYQDRGPQHQSENVTVESRCRVQIPEAGGQLGLRVSTLPPLAAPESAYLDAEVTALYDGKREVLYSNRLPVFHPFGLQLVRNWPKERRIDISHLAGKEVTLVFSSHRRGWVKSDPFSYKGYATMWLEPRILHKPKRRAR